MIDPLTTPLAAHIREQPTRPDQLRRIWSAITADPALPIRDLAARLDLSARTTSAGLQQLAHAGYIEIDRRIAGGRRIVIPFVAAGPIPPLPYPANTHKPRRRRRQG